MTDVTNDEANVWQPEFNSTVFANTKRVEESLVATAGQMLFTLTKFSYVPNTGSLAIYKQGLLLAIVADWNEQTSTTFALNSGAAVGSVITAVGFTEITGTNVYGDNPTFDSVKIAHATDVATNGNVVLSYTTDLVPVLEHHFDDPTGAKGYSWFTLDASDVEQQFSLINEYMTLPTPLAAYGIGANNIATTKEYVLSVVGGGGSGPFVADPGTNLLPAYTFIGDTDTGMFSSVAGAMDFTANGVVIMTFSAFGIAMQGAVDMGNNVIQNVKDPTAGGEVADRDYNDLRYMPIAPAPGQAVAGGHITSDGAGAQTITDCFGVTSVTISGTNFIIVLSTPVTSATSMSITCGFGSGVGVRSDTVNQTSTTQITYTLVLGGAAATTAALQFHFMVHDTRA